MKNAILFYFEKPFKWAYFWHDFSGHMLKCCCQSYQQVELYSHFFAYQMTRTLSLSIVSRQLMDADMNIVCIDDKIKTIITELCHWKTLHRKMQMCEKEDREHAYVRPVSHLIPSVAHFHKNCLSLAAQILVFSSEKNRNIAVMTMAHFIKQQYAVGKRKCQIIFWCYREKFLLSLHTFTLIYIYSYILNIHLLLYFKE